MNQKTIHRYCNSYFLYKLTKGTTIAANKGCTHSFYDLMKEFEGEESNCRTHRRDSIGEEAVEALPILFPFVIEFTLIGFSAFLLMSFHIGR